MTIKRSFIEYMEDVLNLGVFGTDIFADIAPLDGPTNLWWVTSSGGSALQKNHTGEKIKQYQLNVFYRSNDAQEVDETLHDFEVAINTSNCDQLTDFDTIELEAFVFPSDQDIDSEERTVGLVQVTVRSYL